MYKEHIHADTCNHGPDAFYGMVTLYREKGDLYFYSKMNGYDSPDGMDHYCFRYGPDGNYQSGTMAGVISTKDIGAGFTAEQVNNMNNADMRLIQHYMAYKGWST